MENTDLLRVEIEEILRNINLLNKFIENDNDINRKVTMKIIIETLLADIGILIDKIDEEMIMFEREEE